MLFFLKLLATVLVLPRLLRRKDTPEDGTFHDKVGSNTMARAMATEMLRVYPVVLSVCHIMQNMKL